MSQHWVAGLNKSNNGQRWTARLEINWSEWATRGEADWSMGGKMAAKLEANWTIGGDCIVDVA